MEDSEPINDINLAALWMRVWRRRFLFATIVFASAVGGIFAMGVSMLSARDPVVYYLSLTGIENSRYPNGTEFTPTDLLVPDVIAAVAKRFDIKDESALRDALAVRFGSGLEQSVHEKYRARLAPRSLSAVEIEAINTAYIEELERVVRSGLRIDLDYGGLKVAPSTGVAIASALPEVWKEVYPRKFKIFADTKLQNVSVPREVLTLDDSTSLLVAETVVSNIRRGLRLISEDNRLDTILTTAGNNATNLIETTERFVKLYFNPLFASAIVNAGPVLQTQVRQIAFEVDNLKRQLTGMEDTLESLANFQKSEPGSSATDSNSGAGSVQVGDSVLAEILGLAQRANLSSYLENTLNKRQELIVELSEMEKKLAIIRSPIEGTLDNSIRQAASTQLAEIVSEYNELLAISKAKIVESAGSLFTPAASPVVEGSFLPRKAMIFLTLCIGAGVLIGLCAAMLMPDRQRSTSQTSHRLRAA